MAFVGASKKFALFFCCLMTMQALRLVISTAGFCVVRFHIDCELFNIFISRLVNAVMMSQLFGNWLGDLIVFAASGPLKLHAIVFANWAVFVCFSSALGCIVHTESGHLTGFYWSMVIAYFWWKVGEAPSGSIGGSQVDWYFAGFTLSGVWAAMLKGAVMMCITEEKGIHSDVLGEVNVTVVGTVSVVGRRSVKTTVDYRASRSLFGITICVTFLMCTLWDIIATAVNNVISDWATGTLAKSLENLKNGDANDNELAEAIKTLKADVQTASGPVNLSEATVTAEGVTQQDANKIVIVVKNATGGTDGQLQKTPDGTEKIQGALQKLREGWTSKITDVDGNLKADDTGDKKKLTLTVTTGSEDRGTVLAALQKAAKNVSSPGDNKLVKAIKKVTSTKVDTLTGVPKEATLDFNTAEVWGGGVEKGSGTDNTITITVEGVTSKDAKTTTQIKKNTAWGTADVEKEIKGQLDGLIGAGRIESVGLSGTVKPSQTTFALTIKVTVNTSTNRDAVLKELLAAATSKAVDNTNNKVAAGIRALGQNKTVNTTTGQTANLNFGTAEVDKESGVTTKDAYQWTITVKNVSASNAIKPDGEDTMKVANEIKGKLGELGEQGQIASVKLEGTGQTLTITVTVTSTGRIGSMAEVKNVAMWTGIVLTAIMAVPGALLFGLIFGRRKWCVGLGAVTAWLVTRWAYGTIVADVSDGEQWVESFKWATPPQNTTTWAPMKGLGAGLVTGALVGIWIGLMVGAAKGQVKRKLLSGLAAGAFIGGFVGLWSGEIYNGNKTWTPTNFLGKNNKVEVVVCGFLIVVLGLGTVYSIYPGMAPCSITQFQYFNIADILILILSAIAPILIMVVDLAELDWKLGSTILQADKDWDIASTEGKRMWAAVGSALVMLVATLICEIIVLSVMQHPLSKMAQKVTTSGWRAVLLTVTMVTCQLTSTNVGFGCVAAGGGFNDGVNNALSTVTLWSIECTCVLGEGYLTELKKYEPGKWPTQGMGKWATYKWWNGKAFGNAWAIWCCIGTTDLRRDIMLCRQ